MGFLYRSIPSREKTHKEISIEVEGVPIRRLSIRPIFLPFFLCIWVKIVSLRTKKRGGLMRDAKIIVVDDNEAILRSLRTVLSHEFKTIVTVSSPVLLPALLRNGDVDLVLLDMNFGTGKQGGGEGLFWLDRILELKNPPAVILITAFGDIELAVSSLKKGATDFIVKPWDNENLIQTLTYVLVCRAESDESEISSVAESLVSHPCTLEDMERQFIAEVLKERREPDACGSTIGY